ncbi:MAG: glycogen synthase GlgA [Acidobacteria bacterium]|nr:MAG: glycogen synthase GlgA [Acidobacteriota bacterium]
MRITHVSAEAEPFAKTGGLADAVTAFCKELARLGQDVTLMLPFYQGISISPTKVIGPMTLSFGGRHVSYSFVESQFQGFKLVLVDAPQYFQRGGIYRDANGDYGDNDERYICFTRACLEYYRIENRPDVFHAHDWHAALLPLFLRTHYYHDNVSRTPVVFTIHNLAYQGIFGPERYGLLELGRDYFTPENLEFKGTVNFMKSGILYSDVVTTVSPRYSLEIQTPEGGFGLDGVLRRRTGRLFGILNGIDQETWDPQRDPYLGEKYSPSNLAGKARCKQEVLQAAGLNPNTSSPAIGIVSRFVAQKGLDLVEAAADRILDMDTMLLILGSGERRYEQFFDWLRSRRPDRVAAAIKFDNALAHKIEAGADMFLMPSRYEPCGLNQMYSLRYGTVPIVRAVGGLDDTVHEWDWNTRRGNGFKFYGYTPEDLLGAVARARMTFENKAAWHQIMLNGMAGDYSWIHSAMQYLMLYEQAVELKS